MRSLDCANIGFAKSLWERSIRVAERTGSGFESRSQAERLNPVVCGQAAKGYPQLRWVRVPEAGFFICEKSPPRRVCPEATGDFSILRKFS